MCDNNGTRGGVPWEIVGIVPRWDRRKALCTYLACRISFYWTILQDTFPQNTAQRNFGHEAGNLKGVTLKSSWNLAEILAQSSSACMLPSVDTQVLKCQCVAVAGSPFTRRHCCSHKSQKPNNPTTQQQQQHTATASLHLTSKPTSRASIVYLNH